MPFMGGLFGGNTAGNQAGNLSALGTAQAMNASYDALKNANSLARKDLTDHNYWQPQYDAAYRQNGALSMLQNSLGLNGQDGKISALSAFQNSNPGFESALDMGIQARDRSAASRGMLGSGNQQMAITKYANDLANQNYGDWQSKLGGLAQLGSQAAAGMTGQQNNLASLDNGLGQQLANMFMGGTQNAMNAMYNGNMADAAANAQGGKNLFGAIMGGLNLATGGLGGMGNLFSGASNMLGNMIIPDSAAM